MKFSAFPSAAAVLMVAVACAQTEEPVEEPQVQLETPSAEILDVGATEATLSWNKVKGALVYNIFAGDDPDPFKAIDTIAVLKGLEPDTDYSFRVQAVPATRSRYTPSELSAALNARTLLKPRLSAPELRIEALASDAFTVAWSPVDSAASYSYSIEPSGVEPAVDLIVDTVISFTGLVPDTEYRLTVKAVPDEEFADIFEGGKPAIMTVRTNAIVALADPELTVERASSIRSIISWDEVEGADYFRYVLDGGDTLTTTGLSAVFEGLTKDSDHKLCVQSCSDNSRVYSNSGWSSVEFRAVYDFVSTLKIEGVSATEGSLTLDVSATGGDYYYVGCLPKALCLVEGTTQVDTAAIVSSVLETIEEEAASLMELGKYKTISEARASVLDNTSMSKVWKEGIYSELAYVCYALGIEPDGTRTSALMTAEITTPAHDFYPADGFYFESGDFFSFSVVPAMGYSSSYGTYDGENYVTMQMKSLNDTAISEVRYYIFTLANFKSQIGTDEASIITGIDVYFDGGKGGTMSASSLEKVNSGSTISSGYANRTADTHYVLFCRAISESGDRYYRVSSFHTLSHAYDWLQLGLSDSGAATICSAVPISAGKAKCGGLGSLNNSYDKLASYVSSAADLSAARVSTLNSGGTVSISYSLTAGTNYNFVVTATSVAGDTVVRNLVIRK